MSSLQLNLIFPTVIGYEENVLSDEDNKKIIDSCYLIKEKYPNKNNDWGSGDRSPYASFNSINLIDIVDFDYLVSKVTNSVNLFTQQFENPNEFYCQDAWINIYEKNNYQEPHHHHGHFVSAVYFAKAPEGSGPIVFIRPDADLPSINPNHFFGVDNWPVIPKENTLLIFKSNIKHYVLHGENSEERISIALNFNQRQKG